MHAYQAIGRVLPYCFGLDLLQMVGGCLENVVVIDVHVIFTLAQKNC